MENKRSPQIINLNEVEARDLKSGKRFAGKAKRLAANAGSKQLGCSWFEVPPGAQAFPHHSHFGNEEAFFILSGEGTVRLGDEKFQVRAGDYVACPIGTTAHSLINTGKESLTYLGISTANATDIVIYPDSKKIGVMGGGDMHKGLRASPFVRFLKDQESVDYYLDEE